MKSKDVVTPAVLILVVLLGVALAIGFVGRPWEAPRDKPGTTLVDDGPNATLSNEELVSRAVIETNALRSYHLELEAEGPRQTGGVTPVLTMSLDVSLVSTTTVGRITYVPGEDLGTGAFLGLNNYLHADDSMTVDVDISEGGWRESYDGGRSWSEPEHIGFGPTFAPLMFAYIWDNHGSDSAGMQRFLAAAKFNDAVPRLEKVAGVLTRHIAAAVPKVPAEKAYAQFGLIGALGAGSIDMWVATGAAPTIQRIRLEGGIDIQDKGDTAAVVRSEPFTITWEWSGFNGDPSQ